MTKRCHDNWKKIFHFLCNFFKPLIWFYMSDWSPTLAYSYECYEKKWQAKLKQKQIRSKTESNLERLWSKARAKGKQDLSKIETKLEVEHNSSNILAKLWRFVRTEKFWKRLAFYRLIFKGKVDGQKQELNQKITMPKSKIRMQWLDLEKTQKKVEMGWGSFQNHSWSFFKWKPLGGNETC